MKNRLHALLPYAYPEYRSFFADPFGKTALAFWQAYPSPGHLQGVSVEELTGFLQEHSHWCLGRKRAAAILAAAPQTGGAYQAERDALVRQAVAQLIYQQEAIGQADAQLDRLVRAMGQYLNTLSGVDVVQAAELLAWIGDVHRFATPDKLVRYAGIAPKEWSSADKQERRQSAHGQRSLHAALFRLAVANIQVSRTGEPRNPQSRAYYEKKLKEGKSKQAALTCLMRVLVRIIWGMLKHREPYLKVPLGAGR